MNSVPTSIRVYWDAEDGLHDDDDNYLTLPSVVHISEDELREIIHLTGLDEELFNHHITESLTDEYEYLVEGWEPLTFMDLKDLKVDVTLQVVNSTLDMEDLEYFAKKYLRVDKVTCKEPFPHLRKGFSVNFYARTYLKNHILKNVDKTVKARTKKGSFSFTTLIEAAHNR